MTQIEVVCKCNKNGGFIAIKDNDYKIDCSNCGREYIVTTNGKFKETIMSKIKHLGVIRMLK